MAESQNSGMPLLDGLEIAYKRMNREEGRGRERQNRKVSFRGTEMGLEGYASLTFSSTSSSSGVFASFRVITDSSGVGSYFPVTISNLYKRYKT